MSAIGKIREIRVRYGSDSYGAYVPFNTTPDAILELADRLCAIEERLSHVPQAQEKASKPATTESPPEPFRISGPGRYKCHQGGANVQGDGQYRWGDMVWKGIYQGRNGYSLEDGTWDDAGHYHYDDEPCDFDIIAGPLPDAVQTAGLTGYDLVKPDKPETKRIQGWMNLFASNFPKSGLTQGAILYETKAEADKQPGALAPYRLRAN